MSVSSDTSNSSDISECAICLEEKTGFVAKIDCGHIYHYSCVQSWINKKKNYKKCCCICETDTEIIQLLGNETVGNESLDNETFGNKSLYNKSLYNESLDNETFGNETFGNETFGNIPLDNLPLIENKTISCCNIL